MVAFSRRELSDAGNAPACDVGFLCAVYIEKFGAIFLFDADLRGAPKQARALNEEDTFFPCVRCHRAIDKTRKGAAAAGTAHPDFTPLAFAQERWVANVSA